MSYFQIFDPVTHELVMDETSVIFRVVGRVYIVGAGTGNPDLSGSSGTIVDDGLLTGTPYCWAMWAGSVNNGGASSADPPAPNIEFYGNTLVYSYLWGDWWFIYGVA